MPQDKIAIVTDSVACLPPELTGKYGIGVIPAGNIYHAGKIYRDSIDLSHAEAYRILESSPGEFFTGPTSPAEFIEVFRNLGKTNSAVIYISLSSKLSTLYNAAVIARDMAVKEIPDIRIEIFDSATATAAQGFVALASARAANDGKSLDEVLTVAQKVKRRVDLFYVLDTVRYVYRTGRVPRPVAEFGSKLNVKPLVTIKNGRAQLLGLVRNTGRGIQSLLKVARDHIGSSPVHLAILHADAPAEAEELRERFARQYDCKEIWISEFSPLMVYATGKGVLGIAFYTEKT
jgi:DegV family protein with EDD domain